jgi:predicted DNA repair protein MutK
MANSLLLLLDDIATLMDDVAVLSKVAAKKTAGVLGDDLALNAEQVSGVRADRELPVVWAVAKGSFRNKFILVPAALLISAFMPWLITPLLMLGGAFLCFEGFEKVFHRFLHSHEDRLTHHKETLEAVANPEVDMVAFEKKKIAGAIRTDFILSAEIIVITLGAVAEAPFMTQVLVVSGMALLLTALVYAFVAAIVRLDDWGLALLKAKSSVQQNLGRGILRLAPYLMKTLSFVGTLAMFLVGGGILLHGTPHAHEVVHHIIEYIEHLPSIGHVLAVITPTLLNAVYGLIAGGIVVLFVKILSPLFPKGKQEAH